MANSDRETPINPDVEQIIRSSLAATSSWGWSSDDSKWSAAGAAQKYLEQHSTMSVELASAMSLEIVEDIMAEEAEPTMDELAGEAMHLFSQALTQEQEDTGPAMRYCSSCGGHHYIIAGEWFCPLSTDRPLP